MPMHKSIRLILGAVALITAVPLLPAVPRGDEPIAVPRSIKQGIDFVYVDPQMSTVARKKQKPRNWLARVFKGPGETATNAPNPVFFQFAQGLEQYRNTWGSLPQGKIPAGPVLKPGSTGKR